MKWGNYIKRTAVRRVVWVVVGVVVYALLSALGVAGEAHAQSYPTCSVDRASDGTCPSPAEALAVVEARAALLCAQQTAAPSAYTCTGVNPGQVIFTSGPGYVGYAIGSYNWVHTNGFDGTNNTNRMFFEDGCPAGTEWREDLKQCAGPCEGLGSRQYNRNTSIWGAPPGNACVSGCAYTQDAASTLCTLVEEGPTAGYWCNMIYQPTGGTCEAGEDIPPPDPDAPDAACSADEVRLPNGQCSPRGNCPVGQHEVDGVCNPTGSCPAGFSKAPDGSCVPQQCPAGQAMGADGTCKEDGNNDGTPDEDEDGGDGTNKDGLQFSGGESCDVPPACSGDAIMCGQARIQWRIDCNTRRNVSVHGGMACGPGNMPICTGEKCDEIERVNLVNQWKAACALQDLAGDGGDGDDGGNGDMSGVEDRLDGIANFLDGDGDCMATEEGCGEGGDDHWIDGDDVEASEWSSGLPGTGSCPAPISRTISLGQHVQDIEFSYQPLCDFAALMRWVLITAATILSALMIGGFRSNA